MTTHKTCSIITQLTTRQTPHSTRMILGAIVGKTNQSRITSWSSISSHCWDKWFNKWLINITQYQGTLEQALTLTLHTKMNASYEEAARDCRTQSHPASSLVRFKRVVWAKLCWISWMITLFLCVFMGFYVVNSHGWYGIWYVCLLQAHDSYEQ